MVRIPRCARAVRGLLALVLAVATFGCHRADHIPVQPYLLDEVLASQQDESALIGNVTSAEFFVVYDAAALQSLRQRLGIALFADTDVDFDHEMIVGSVAAPAARKRDYRLLRVIYSSDMVEVHLVSYDREKLDSPLTPYVFARLPRSDAPVRLYLNDRLASAVDLPPLEPGIHELFRTSRAHYAVNVPQGLEMPAPLLVFLHSSGSNGSRWAPNFDILAPKYGFVVVTPTNRNGYYWTSDRDFAAVMDAIDEVKMRVSIDPERIYLAGNSAGGHAAYPLAMKYPDIFKGVVASAGRLNPDVPDKLLEAGRDIPVLILCGESDASVPIDEVRSGAQRLEQHGFNVTVRAYPSGHGVLAPETGAFEDMFRWLSMLAYGTDAPRAPYGAAAAPSLVTQ